MKVWITCDEMYPVYEVYTDGEIYDLEVDIPEELYQKFKFAEKAFWQAQKEIAEIYGPAERAANIAREERYAAERERMYSLEAIDRAVKHVFPSPDTVFHLDDDLAKHLLPKP